jgi:hypothetical protein
LDQRGGDYKIDSTFETASGTTNVQITRAKSITVMAIVSVVGILVFLLIVVLILPATDHLWQHQVRF